MTPLEERIREYLDSPVMSSRQDMEDEFKQTIAPDCEDTAGLDEQEKLLWLAMNPEREWRYEIDEDWHDYVGRRVFKGVVLRRKPKPKKPRVGWVNEGGRTEPPNQIPCIKQLYEAVERTPEVEEALKKAGIEV